MSIRDEIINGMALAFFACAYAEQADECEQSLAGEIMNQLPEQIDPAALHAARTLDFDMERENRTTLKEIFHYAERLPKDGADRPLSADLFGHYCAMQAMGQGVGLESFGYAVEENIAVPYCEFGSHSLENDYFTMQGDQGDE